MSSEESCLSVCVRLRDASARARVSSVGLAAAAAAEAVPEADDELSHRHISGADSEGDGLLAAAADEVVGACEWACREAAGAGAEADADAEAEAEEAAGAATRDAPDVDGDAPDRRPPLGVTVDSCSWISIMWSPRRIVRFSGALPDRKSFTCESLRLSSACITLCSGRCASKPVSTLGNKVSLLPSTSWFSCKVPSRSCLSLCNRHMRSLGTFSFLEISFFSVSTVSVLEACRSNCPPVVGVTLTVRLEGDDDDDADADAAQPHPGCGEVAVVAAASGFAVSDVPPLLALPLSIVCVCLRALTHEGTHAHPL